jgi:hypothetical protein
MVKKNDLVTVIQLLQCLDALALADVPYSDALVARTADTKVSPWSQSGRKDPGGVARQARYR